MVPKRRNMRRRRSTLFGPKNVRAAVSILTDAKIWVGMYLADVPPANSLTVRRCF